MSDRFRAPRSRRVQIREVALYLFVGGSSAVLEILCTWWLARSLPAAVAGIDSRLIAVNGAVAAATLYCYVLNKVLVFRDPWSTERRSRDLIQFAGYSALTLANIGFKNLAAWLLSIRLGWPITLVNAGAIALTATWNFLLSKYLIFAPRPESAQD